MRQAGRACGVIAPRPTREGIVSARGPYWGKLSGGAVPLAALFSCLCFLFSVVFGLLSCLPPNADAHELTESLALRSHYEQAHHDSELLDFLLDHYAGQSHRHDGESNSQDH